MKARKI